MEHYRSTDSRASAAKAVAVIRKHLTDPVHGTRVIGGKEGRYTYGKEHGDSRKHRRIPILLFMFRSVMSSLFGEQNIGCLKVGGTAEAVPP
jgi:hypothetical protein